jgi:hypothetical protein
MELDGARIYDDGVEIDKGGEKKIRPIVTSIKTLSPTSDVGMKFVKSGRVKEALLWGKAKDGPIGVYNRGLSLNAVLDTIQGQSHPLARSSKGYSENILTPVKLRGVVVPWIKALSGGRESEFKLVCASGLEYFFVTDPELKNVLSKYIWEEVKVIGLFNISNMTLIPQKVFPKGPRGEMENVIDLAAWKSRDLVKKLVKNVNDIVVVPGVVLAVITA